MSKRILIAEDELVTKELLTSIATNHGYDVRSVTDGVDLLTIAANEKFDVIITDLMMPDLNGASAAEIMKMQGNTTPVIALTALSNSDLAAVQDKFTKIFTKPCDVRELFDYVDSLIGK
ncbi:MAG: response regulator [Proteobacteria bacterium]|nr:response regulator [Pseudomonadota bacterium]